jgi:hypothetical protein
MDLIFYFHLGCAYQCHAKCINSVVRKCPSLKVSVETPFIQSICPEVGLPDQNYQCYECKSRFTLSKISVRLKAYLIKDLEDE